MADTRRTLSALQALLADNTAGDISAQDGRDVLVSSHPENMVRSDVLANIPASGQLTGDLFFPTNAPYVYRWTGSIWQAFLAGPAVTPPDAGSWSWVNQGSATVVSTNGPLVIHNDANVNNSSWKLQAITAPATPYVKTLCFSITGFFDSCAAGVGWRQSSDGKLVMVNKTTASLTVFATKWDSVSSASTDYGTWASLLAMSRGLHWVRLADNGTNRIISYSPDGFTWMVLHTVGRTDYLTANQVVFGVYGNATSEQNISLVGYD